MWLTTGVRLVSLEGPEPADPDGDEDAADHAPEGQAGQSPQPPLPPGNLTDVLVAIAAATLPLHVYAGGRDITFNQEKKLSKIGALKELIEVHELREKAARAVLAEAERLGLSRKMLRLALLKQAAGQPPGTDMISGAPNSPPFPEPNIGYDPLTGANVPTIPLSEYNVRVTDLAAARTNRDVYLPTSPDLRSMAVAQQAAQTGQKEVFDTSLLSGLLKVVRQESMVDRYLADVMKGMDRLGRILFTPYWHGEEFAERYGAEEMPELEDALRNAFESAGTLLLELKKKTIDANPDEGTNVDLRPLANQ
jgi:hypothetical protein